MYSNNYANAKFRFENYFLTFAFNHVHYHPLYTPHNTHTSHKSIYTVSTSSEYFSESNKSIFPLFFLFSVIPFLINKTNIASSLPAIAPAKQRWNPVVSLPVSYPYALRLYNISSAA